MEIYTYPGHREQCYIVLTLKIYGKIDSKHHIYIIKKYKIIAENKPNQELGNLEFSLRIIFNAGCHTIMPKNIS